ncbi:helix-turn-helix domain-containing protein [Cutibacterium avidum]|uniref:helix-turn-helix transcriptional regulator n=1 Tax=Cutibacterium avidum TaxID=33010 RepID=UPI0020944DD7|nr:helix-turn-helix domain-containing protein [Cutibacterium avidum]MCO6633047.1 helix-turn-helix domain-containing protein [Cutibacterium avidum]MCO6661015.1 helix-turn-helix domain-containing protein [Cutibacterium avidum]MDQ9049693.1 helix-turn-helix domain-containing protein [Cutibacterium avidum]
MRITNPGAVGRARRRRSLSQTDLAAITGCTQQFISMIETGTTRTCSEALALTICRKLDIDVEDAFAYGEDSYAPAHPSSQRGKHARAAA